MVPQFIHGHFDTRRRKCGRKKSSVGWKYKQCVAESVKVDKKLLVEEFKIRKDKFLDWIRVRIS